MAARLPTGTVTFLFSDIEGSTRVLTTLGDRYPEVLARHRALIREPLSAAGGVEIETEGDSFFVVFPDAPAAVGAVAAAQRALAAEPWPEVSEVRVRMGLHTGAGIIADGQYVGMDVHRAARIAAAAHGGQVVLSDATRALAVNALPDGVSMRDLGDHRLKDLPEPMRLYQLVIDGLRAEFPPLRSLGRGNLPEPMTSFIGREEEIAQVERLLETSRLVTLTGPGGTGKTRLLIQVAHRVEDRFPEGAWFVPLESLTKPELVLPAIARILAVPEEPGRAMEQTLGESLAKRQLLLALDNLEQVIATGPQIGTLLAGAPAVRAVCSSREALRVAGEQEYEVPPLDQDLAVRLFIERARQVRPEFDPQGEDLAAVATICAKLDGLPLAIELAAARIRLFPVRTLLARLADRLDMLRSGARDVPERQRTLRAAIEWSFDLLDPSERETFARLSVFTGGADLAAIEAILDPTGELTDDTVATLTSLVEKSLLRAEEGPTGEPRFRMLDTIHAYAAELLAASEAYRPIRERHLRYFLQMAEGLEPELFVHDPGNAVARLEADHENIRSAIEWSLASGHPSLGLRISGTAWRFWQQRGHLAEARPLLERLLEAPEPTPDPAARARGLTAYGGIVYWQGDHAAAQQAYEQALELHLSTGDQERIALAEYNLGWMLAFARKLPESERLLEHSSSLYEQVGDERGRLMVDEAVAMEAMIAGDLERARDVAEGVVSHYRRLGMRFHHADTLGLLTSIYLELGDTNSARRSLTDSAAVSTEIRELSSRVALLEFGAGLALAEGRAADAARLLGAIQGLRDRGERFFLPSQVIPFTDPEPRTREALSSAQFDAAFAEGRQWSIETAIEYAARPASSAGDRKEE